MESYTEHYDSLMATLDKYMPGTELEVDVISDGTDVLIPGIMQHVERAGEELGLSGHLAVGVSEGRAVGVAVHVLLADDDVADFDAGAEALVAGSAVFKAPSPEEEIIKILEA